MPAQQTDCKKEKDAQKMGIPSGEDYRPMVEVEDDMGANLPVVRQCHDRCVKFVNFCCNIMFVLWSGMHCS